MTGILPNPFNVPAAGFRIGVLSVPEAPHATAYSKVPCNGAPGVSSQRDQPVLGHFNPWPLVIVVCGSDFPWPVFLRDVRVVGVSSLLQSVSGSFLSTIQMFVLPKAFYKSLKQINTSSYPFASLWIEHSRSVTEVNEGFPLFDSKFTQIHSRA